ncbi:metal ABC transporter permease [Corynebacterium uterequi]|uniref:ABC-type Mn2+/Zn2+ transport system, permease component n=1 Tax=Corynebacterium uterequi TaxID=1072256 RepID=A0A0G3HH24_9CORY|nr:metal ABC transporter permease [Corynebacterium uterequi]AKK10462.1 ABC-type Mn2+/Zn2+ transport system, permease component [Corynebacterium uterequi]
MPFVIGAVLLAIVTAVACALPGVFIVLRKQSMLIDGIGHAVFPGIVVGYLFSRNLDSPLLLLGAASAGLLVVLGTEALARTRMLSGDAPLGLIFPAMFAIGVIVVSSSFSSVHLDTHVVLVGDLNLASFEHLIIGTLDFGPRYMYVMLAILLLNVAFLYAVFPKLTAATFDAEHAQLLGIPQRTLAVAFMFVVAVTVTAAFNAAGALLIVSLMIAPAATARIFATRLGEMMVATVTFAAVGAVVGFYLAYAVDAATSAGMAVYFGLQFTAVLITYRVFLRIRRGRLAREQAASARVA